MLRSPLARALIALVCVLSATALVAAPALLPPRAARAQERPKILETPPASAAPSPEDAGPHDRLPISAMPTSRFWIPDDLGRSIEVYPPLGEATSAPVVVFLHATCMNPRPVCDLLGGAARNGTFLVCPSGNDSCNGAPDWHGSGPAKSAFLSRDLEKVDARLGDLLSHDDTLIGWSRGAFAARDILYSDVAAGAPRRFTSLVLIAADVSPDPAKMKAAGIRRVLFAAGDNDGAKSTMKNAAAKLAAAGIPTRFDSLGPIGHWLPDDFDARMRPGIAWVRRP